MHPLMSPMTKLPFDFSPAYSNGKGGGVLCEFLGGVCRWDPGADLGEGAGGAHPRDDLRFSNTTGILQKKKYVVYWC